MRRIAIAFIAVGCAPPYVVHPAAVRTGTMVDVVVGAQSVRHAPREQSSVGEFEPHTSGEATVQLAGGYGHRLSDNHGLQMMVAVGGDAAPAVDGYWQFLGGALDIGVGMTGSLAEYGVAVGAYGLSGKEWAIGPTLGLRLDAGVHVHRIPSHPKSSLATGPQALVGLRAGALTLALWGDYLHLSSPVYRTYCDESCEPSDLMSRRLAGGVLIRLSP